MGDNIRISALTHCEPLSGNEYIPMTQANSADGVLTSKYGNPSDFADFTLNFVFPAGIVVPYGGLTAPTGWLLCDGNAVSKATYARLYAAIGGRFGQSSTTFNTPNMGGKIPLGVCGVTNLSSVVSQEGIGPNVSLSVGASGGEFRHTLSASSLPAHAHTMVHSLLTIQSLNAQTTDGSYPPTYSGNVTPNTKGSRWTSNDIWTGTDGPNSYKNGGSQLASDGAHNNIQPYIALNYIIKY